MIVHTARPVEPIVAAAGELVLDDERAVAGGRADRRLGWPGAVLLEPRGRRVEPFSCTRRDRAEWRSIERVKREARDPQQRRLVDLARGIEHVEVLGDPIERRPERIERSPIADGPDRVPEERVDVAGKHLAARHVIRNRCNPRGTDIVVDRERCEPAAQASGKRRLDRGEREVPGAEPHARAGDVDTDTLERVGGVGDDRAVFRRDRPGVDQPLDQRSKAGRVLVREDERAA
jgi:hypothetical protein